ncbi:hypothetical protein PanWU01x14_140580 [Parasponia andersonii]|uniref:Uncharacterized protein n=1 Tax=Parasponia andersonii TaxID=3476 RepID=A0A2P5CM26_PARAD|nr:hypothetical protein PanWU01x14_140580 [Parasponia andersonii]
MGRWIRRRAAEIAPQERGTELVVIRCRKLTCSCSTASTWPAAFRYYLNKCTWREINGEGRRLSGGSRERWSTGLAQNPGWPIAGAQLLVFTRPCRRVLTCARLSPLGLIGRSDREVNALYTRAVGLQ